MYVINHIKTLITLSPYVAHCVVVREDAIGQIGLFRYRLTLSNGDLMEMFERFSVVAGHLQITKYSFHWQDTDGQLRKRWDNATHYPSIPTNPHHLHDGAQDNVLPHEPMSAQKVLDRDYYSKKQPVNGCFFYGL